jgi:hypothetical protein
MVKLLSGSGFDGSKGVTSSMRRPASGDLIARNASTTQRAISYAP